MENTGEQSEKHCHGVARGAMYGIFIIILIFEKVSFSLKKRFTVDLCVICSKTRNSGDLLQSLSSLLNLRGKICNTPMTLLHYKLM